jgi:hypothetical protein
MSSESPPPLPTPGNEPNLPAKNQPRKGPPLALMILAGVLLFGLMLTVLFAPDLRQSPVPYAVAIIGAFVSVFFKGYRGIFIGFFATMGVVILVAVVVCFGIIATSNSGIGLK